MDKLQKQIYNRYNGLQDILSAIGSGGCHFLSCCSIIEEVNKKPLDLIEAARYVLRCGLFTDGFYGTDCIPFLNYFTGKKWSRSKLLKTLPDVIGYNQFTEIKYHRDSNGYDHFTRRYVDTKNNSQTVAKGCIAGYYIYTYEV